MSSAAPSQLGQALPHLLPHFSGCKVKARRGDPVSAGSSRTSSSLLGMLAELLSWLCGGLKPWATKDGDDSHCAITGVSSAGCVHLSKDAVK